MEERKAIYYGKIELIPGIVCDGYVLDDPEMTAFLSERGTADLLDMDRKTLQNVATKGIPKMLESFWNKGLNVATKTVEVAALNSHHKGRKIVVYDT